MAVVSMTGVGAGPDRVNLTRFTPNPLIAGCCAAALSSIAAGGTFAQ